MKILDENLNQDEITISVDNLNDLWYLYNIIRPDDIVYSRTTRRIRQDSESARADKGEKVPLYLGIRVEKLEFHEFTNRLRINGKITDGPEDLISLHSYHTLNIEVNSELKIIKEEWPKYILERINDAVDSSHNPNILVLCIEKGECTIAEVSNIGVRVIKSLRTSIPGKYYDVDYHKSALNDFFADIYMILRENTSESIKYIIIAGPGFTKDHFFDFLKENNYSHLENIILAAASGASVNAVYEVLKSDKIKNMIKSFKINEEIELVNEIFERIGKDLGTIALKLEEIEKADLFGAIDTFLILDKRFRECSSEERKYFENLLKNIENKGGKIEIISSLHPAGEQLEKLGGTAALLRFRISE